MVPSKGFLLAEADLYVRCIAYGSWRFFMNGEVNGGGEAICKSPLETENTWKLIGRYGLPCIISLLVGALYNIVDQLFIANASYLGSYGNAANTVVFPLTVIALAVATMVGDGCCAFVSISLGAKENGKAGKGVGNSIVLVLVSGVVLMLVYLLCSDWILTAFGARVNAETFRLSKEYFFWISLGIPFYMFGQALNPIIRSDGSPRFAMVSLLAGAVTNCILDPIFIYPLGWGMMGAAVATVIGQIVSAALVVFYLFRMKEIRLDSNCFRLEGGVVRAILPLGLTSFLSQVSIVLSMAAVNNMCLKYGAMDPVFGQEIYAQIPTAVIGIVMKLFQIVVSIAIGLSAGCIPIIGFNVGAGRRDRVREIMWRMLFLELVIGVVATLVFECFPSQIIGLFGAANESEHYSRFAIRCIRLFLSCTALSCINKGTFIFMQAVGKPWTSTALSMLREVVFGVGLVLLLPVWFGLDGLLYFMAVADIVSFIVSLVVVLRMNRRLSCKTGASA